jgi:hypothetical protein
LRFPWSCDDSIKLLPREVLSVIYTFLRDPADMWSFIQVSKTFYKAGELYPHYQAHIQKILPSFMYPVWDDTFNARQFFFAFCFVSCKTDKDLSAKWMAYMRTDGQGKNIDIERGNSALYYVLWLSGGMLNINPSFVRRKEDWTCVYDDYFGAILNEFGIYTMDGTKENIPFNILRERIIQILFY